MWYRSDGGEHLGIIQWYPRISYFNNEAYQLITSPQDNQHFYESHSEIDLPVADWEFISEAAVKFIEPRKGPVSETLLTGEGSLPFIKPHLLIKLNKSLKRILHSLSLQWQRGILRKKCRFNGID